MCYCLFTCAGSWSNFMFLNWGAHNLLLKCYQIFEREWDDKSPKSVWDLCGAAPLYLTSCQRKLRILPLCSQAGFKSWSAPLTASAYGWEFIKPGPCVCILWGWRRPWGAAQIRRSFWSVTQDSFVTMEVKWNSQESSKHKSLLGINGICNHLMRIAWLAEAIRLQ